MTKEIYILERGKTNSYSLILNFFINYTLKTSFDISTTDILIRSYAQAVLNKTIFDDAGRVITYENLVYTFRENAYNYLDSYFKISKVLDEQGKVIHYY